jgi:2-polyprenyl-6-methoxyphenol hydroxylase-like FAD-dependent oxidoreductase
MQNLLGENAIVIGGGIDGLLAARVLFPHYHQVMILEKDVYSKKAGPRNGIPQSNHIHILLMKGKQILTELFPKLEANLISKGAHKVDLLADVKYHLATGVAMRFNSGMYTIACTRPLLEYAIRTELLVQSQNIKIIDNARVTNLIKNPGENKIVGVNAISNNATQDFYGELIVDASGRKSETIQWLEKIGFGKPKEIRVNSFIGYATQKYKFPDDLNLDWKSLIVMTSPPTNPRMAVIYPVEDNHIMVGLLGIGKTHPPTDAEGFLEFAKQIGVGEVEKTIENSEPVSSIFGYRETGSRKYLFEKMKEWPENFIMLGDSVCAFNPIYGQGISVAAMCAKTLGECLKSKGKIKTLERGFAKNFQKRVAKVNSFPWLLGTSEDLRWPTSQGPRPNLVTKMMQKYVNEVMLLGPQSEIATRSFFTVLHMLKSPLVLFHPRVILDLANKKLVKRN